MTTNEAIEILQRLGNGETELVVGGDFLTRLIPIQKSDITLYLTPDDKQLVTRIHLKVKR
jgi:hypothetical protein